MEGWSARWRYWYWAALSKPAPWRTLIRLVWRQRITRIVELGVGTGDRAERLIRVAQWRNPGVAISYAGIDLFELRQSADGPGMSLKLAHKRLTATGGKIRLIPGDPFTALARSANSLTGHELLLIAADQRGAALDKSWFYFPRLITPQGLVLVEQPDSDWQLMLAAELQQRAAQNSGRRAA
jgi:hypothetical protein